MVGDAPIGPLLGKELRRAGEPRILGHAPASFAPRRLQLHSGGGFLCQSEPLGGAVSRAGPRAVTLRRDCRPYFRRALLATTFLFPFVAIDAIGAQKQNGGAKLLLQLPYSLPALILAKLSALFAAWLAMLATCLSALVIWRMLGGHLGTGETLNLILGHLLYALVIAGIGLLAASVADASATAAIVSLPSRSASGFSTSRPPAKADFFEASQQSR
jgi:ABC-2 family transporter